VTATAERRDSAMIESHPNDSYQRMLVTAKYLLGVSKLRPWMLHVSVTTHKFQFTMTIHTLIIGFVIIRIPKIKKEN
jgi:hypothetical protein